MKSLWHRTSAAAPNPTVDELDALVLLGMPIRREIVKAAVFQIIIGQELQTSIDVDQISGLHEALQSELGALWGMEPDLSWVYDPGSF